MRISRGKVTVAGILFSTLGIGVLLVTFWTANEIICSDPSLKVAAFTPPVLTAKAFLVLDIESGTDITSGNSNEQLPIASITKLFTAAAFRERTNLVGTTTVTWGDVATEGRAGKLSGGEVYPYHELVQAMLLESSNDAASTILRTDKGVLPLMNEYPGGMGFASTTFSDGSGLAVGNKSTAYELSQLTREIWVNQPHLFDISGREQIIGTYTGWINNNPFINMEGYKGGKHGFTNEAGRTAVAVFTEYISEEEREFLYVVLGSDDLVSDIEQLRESVRKHVSLE